MNFSVGNLGIHISDIVDRTAPAYGKFRFVGSGIPAQLAYTGTPEDIAIVAKHGFFGSLGKRVRTRVFDTAEEAVAAAREAGVTLCSVPGCLCRKHFN